MLLFIAFPLICFFAGMLPAMTGFGVAAVSMAFLPFLLPLRLIIPVVAIISVIATGIVALRSSSTHRIAHILTPVIVGSVLGVMLGSLTLHIIPDTILTGIVGSILFVYGLYGLLGNGVTISPRAWVGTIFGFFGGLSSAIFNIHGPLMGVYASGNARLTKYEVQALISSYMAITGSFTVLGHGLSGRITPEVLQYTAYALPCLLLGMIVGDRVFSH